MISLTYAISGILLIVVGALFERDLLSAAAQTVGWMIVFFVASPAASAAYLTVSETFPIEIRALTIAVFYALGTGLGGVAAPYVFGKLDGERVETERLQRLCLRRGAHVRRIPRRRPFRRAGGAKAARTGRGPALLPLTHGADP